MTLKQQQTSVLLTSNIFYLASVSLAAGCFSGLSHFFCGDIMSNTFKHRGFQIIPLVLLFLPLFSSKSFSEGNGANAGTTHMVGSVISTPCSISMKNRTQTIDFSPLTLNLISNKVYRESHQQPFEIELHDCGSIDPSLDMKTWEIHFNGITNHAQNVFLLRGPSSGLGFTILDNSMNTVFPNQSYSLSQSVVKGNKSGTAIYLRYFLRLELTGNVIQAGNYHGLIRFFIDYK